MWSATGASSARRRVSVSRPAGRMDRGGGGEKDVIGCAAAAAAGQPAGTSGGTRGRCRVQQQAPLPALPAAAAAAAAAETKCSRRKHTLRTCGDDQEVELAVVALGAVHAHAAAVRRRLEPLPGLGPVGQRERGGWRKCTEGGRGGRARQPEDELQASGAEVQPVLGPSSSVCTALAGGTPPHARHSHPQHSPRHPSQSPAAINQSIIRSIE